MNFLIREMMLRAPVLPLGGLPLETSTPYVPTYFET